MAMVCGAGLAGVVPFPCCGHRKLVGGGETPKNPLNLGQPRSSSGTNIIKNNNEWMVVTNCFWVAESSTDNASMLCCFFPTFACRSHEPMYGKSPGFLGFEFGVYVVMLLYLAAYSFSSLYFWLWFSYFRVLLSLCLIWGLSSTHPTRNLLVLESSGSRQIRVSRLAYYGSDVAWNLDLFD